MKNIAVFFGGQSVEHDVSIITGVMTANCIDKEKFSVYPIYVDRSGKWFTGEALLDLDGYKNLQVKNLIPVALTGGDNTLYRIKKNKLKELCKIYVAVNCMHGGAGEDGSLCGLLSFCNIPVCSAGVLSSAVAMDKNITKLVMKSAGIKCLKSYAVDSQSDCKKIADKLGFPLIVKPNLLGSSVGVGRADDLDGLKRCVKYALGFDKTAVIEPCLENFIEINCAIYRDKDGILRVSECERPVGRSEILTFSDKYEGGKRIFPADVSKNISDKIKQTTKKVYELLDFSGVIRIDYFVLDGEIYLNEINSVPGSLAYYLFGDTLKSFKQMLTELIMASERRYLQKNSLKKEYCSGILGSCVGKGAKNGVKRL